MLPIKILLMVAALPSLSVGALAQVVIQPGSAAVFVLKPARAALASVDIRAPDTLPVPSVSGTTATSTVFSVAINEDGTGYYLIQLTTLPAPSVTTVQTTGTSFAMIANTVANPPITGLLASTPYTIYFIAKDSSSNWQTSAVMLAQTTAVTTTADQCTVTASSAIIGTCCASTNSVHVSLARATTSFGTYYPTGNVNFTNSLGSLSTSNTSVQKTGASVWTKIASCP